MGFVSLHVTLLQHRSLQLKMLSYAALQIMERNSLLKIWLISDDKMNCALLSACFSPLTVRKHGVTQLSCGHLYCRQPWILSCFSLQRHCHTVALMCLHTYTNTQFNSKKTYMSVHVSPHVQAHSPLIFLPKKISLYKVTMICDTNHAGSSKKERQQIRLPSFAQDLHHPAS